MSDNSCIAKRAILGVTGSPGSGKTTISNKFAQLGAWIVDVDQAGRWVTNHNLLSRQLIRQKFGPDCFFDNGDLDRKKLGSVVFQDEKQMMKLNRIVHPMMINRVRAQVMKNLYNPLYPLIVVDAALLFELCLHTEVDEVLVVKADLNIRLDRLCTSRKISRQKARQMTMAQLSQEEKAGRANIVLDNSGTRGDLEKQVQIIFKQTI